MLRIGTRGNHKLDKDTAGPAPAVSPALGKLLANVLVIHSRSGEHTSMSCENDGAMIRYQG